MVNVYKIVVICVDGLVLIHWYIWESWVVI